MMNKFKDIEVSSFQLINENLVSGYYQFCIEAYYKNEGGNKLVKRRYKEIEWLHNCLLKEELGCKILDFPEKDILANITLVNSSRIEDRKTNFSYLLKYILNHKYLSLNKNFEKFLTLDNLNVENEELNSKSLVSKTYSVLNTGFNYMFSGKK